MAAVFGRAAAAYDEVIPFFTRFGEWLVAGAGVGVGDDVLDVAGGHGACSCRRSRKAPAWRWLHTRGQRFVIDALPPEAIEELKAACFERLWPHRTPHGYVLRQRARALPARSP